MKFTPCIRGMFLAMVALTISGCSDLEFFWDHEKQEHVDLGVDPNTKLTNSESVRDTIAAVSYFQGMGPMRVRGYGLVIGLGKSGSRDCPRNIYEQLVQRMYKHHEFSTAEVGVKSQSPEELINSLDSAVVEVFGEIPPAAVAGKPFDVAVRALPMTQTKSLRGGRLLPTDLEVFRMVSERSALMGQTLARASGSIFINPFLEQDETTRTEEIQGVILAGGTPVKDRRVRLVLAQPSYQLARRVQDRINARFTGRQKVADAISPSFVQITIPPDYYREPGHFLSLVRALFLSTDPRLVDAKIEALVREIEDPDAPHGQISLCLEGIGQAAIPTIQSLYSAQKDYVSFHAGVAGLRLEDHLACDVIARHAHDEHSEFRVRAIRALGEAEGMGCAGVALHDLLDDDDPRIRVATYEALVKRGDALIRSVPIGSGNFVMDIVPTAQDEFVYAKRTEQPRIALFGEKIKCFPPVFYRAPDGCVTINAQPGDEELTLIRQIPGTDRSSPPVPVANDIARLIHMMGNDAGVDHADRVVGLGLDYGTVVSAVYHLCNQKAVDAEFMLEKPHLEDLFGPRRGTGRPESEF